MKDIKTTLIQLCKEKDIIGAALLDKNGLLIHAQFAQKEQILPQSLDMYRHLKDVGRELGCRGCEFVAMKVGKKFFLAKEVDGFLLLILAKEDASRGRLRFLMERACARILAHRKYGERLNVYEKELLRAQNIQDSLLPKKGLLTEGVQIKGWVVAARVVGGDFYNFFEDAHTLHFLVADVCGKGVDAALYMWMLTSLITQARVHSPSSLLSWLNERMTQSFGETFFATMFYCSFKKSKSTLIYSCAGHSPAILYRGGKSDYTLLKTDGLPLGLFKDASYSQMRLKLQKGDILLLYTDGLTEVLEEERLALLLREYHSLSAEGIAECIKSVFLAGGTCEDDATVLVLKIV